VEDTPWEVEEFILETELVEVVTVEGEPVEEEGVGDAPLDDDCDELACVD